MDIYTVRMIRTSLLQKCDFLMLADFNILDIPTKVLWSTYRQSLRDITQGYVQGKAVVWPTPPANPKIQSINTFG